MTEEIKVKKEPKKRKVRVTVGALNIRENPGLDEPVVDMIRDRGVYAITQEKNGWGKLDDKRGWIMLAHTQPV